MPPWFLHSLPIPRARRMRRATTHESVTGGAAQSADGAADAVSVSTQRIGRSRDGSKFAAQVSERDDQEAFALCATG